MFVGRHCCRQDKYRGASLNISEKKVEITNKKNCKKKLEQQQQINVMHLIN
jgi:hypothetical protein